MVSVRDGVVSVSDDEKVITFDALASSAADVLAGWAAFDRISAEAGASNARLNAHLLDYPVREGWSKVFDELEAVHAQRVALWSAALGDGAAEGFVLRDEVVLPRDFVDALNTGALPALGKYFTLQMGRSTRKEILGGGSGCWRLSFRPGAIISAAQRRDAFDVLGSACGCFGYGECYEGTAGQMVFDPQLAVLERVSSDGGERLTGFQFVVLDDTGVHAYGGRYSGHDIDSAAASTLARKLANVLLGNCGCDYSDENNKALVALTDYLIKTTGSEFDLAAMAASPRVAGSEVRGVALTSEDAYSLGASHRSHWLPVDGVGKAYEERVYDGGFFWTALPSCLPSLLGRKSAEEITSILQQVGVLDDGYTCAHCGRYIDEDDGIYGDCYGLEDDVFCCEDCVRDAQLSVCDEECRGVVLINGSLYPLCD